MSETTKAIRSRREVGGYEWNNELLRIQRLGETLTDELVMLGRYARSVEAANHVTRLVSLSSQITVKALELQDYKA